MATRPHVFAVLLAASALLAETRGRAEEPAPTEVRIQDRGPNRLLLATGIATFGFAYGVSAWVGATSPEAAERFLLVPAVGPFVSLAERPSCAPGSTSSACVNERTYEGLLVASGAMQLAGLAQIAVAYVIRERREVERPVVMPLAIRGGGGIGAMTTF